MFWNNAIDFIPIAFMHDLIDDNATNTVNEVFGIIDNVKGFSNQQFFQSLGTSSLEDFRLEIINNHLPTTSNTQADVSELFESYNID